MKFANIITNEITEALSSTMVDGDQTITGADITHWAKAGWRKIVTIDEPATGYRVGTYGIEEIDGLTCKLTVATSVNLAVETAAATDRRQSFRWAGKTPTHVLTTQKYTSLL
jgi:hypothetical protein